MEKILITGGAGFIGSHLCKKLLDDGYFVICLDNLITGSKKNIEAFLKNSNFKFIEADISKSLTFDYSDIEYIFHLASPASPVDYLIHTEETLLANSQGTLNILNVAKETKAKILIASTSEIYGDPLKHPQKETYWGNVNSFGVRSCYDESKRFSEAATYVFIKKYNIDARIIRIFNTYGPNMQKNDGRVISNFINWAINGLPIKIDGNGTQTRSFCYISDLIEGLKRSMFLENTKGEVFNLGNFEEYEISKISKIILELTNSKSEVIFSDSFREDDPMQRCPDISKAKKILNWEPQVKLADGLEKTIKYYKNL